MRTHMKSVRHLCPVVKITDTPAPETVAACAHMCVCLRAMSEALTTQEDLLTAAGAAKRLGISRRHLYNLIYAGDIATIRIPSRNGNTGEHRIEPSEIEAFKKRNRQRGA